MISKYVHYFCRLLAAVIPRHRVRKPLESRITYWLIFDNAHHAERTEPIQAMRTCGRSLERPQSAHCCLVIFGRRSASKHVSPSISRPAGVGSKRGICRSYLFELKM